MLVIIDNYDSFTYNLVQLFGGLGEDVHAVRNDEISVENLSSEKPDYLVISPGPCAPDQAGISLKAIRHFAGKIPTLGVCLGHQAIAQAFGGSIIGAKELMHGKVSPVAHNGRGLFADLENPLTATRYHSLAVCEKSLPDCLEVTARTSDGEIMGIEHRAWQIHGIQFHPESIETARGTDLMRNFLNSVRNKEQLKTSSKSVT